MQLLIRFRYAFLGLVFMPLICSTLVKYQAASRSEEGLEETAVEQTSPFLAEDSQLHWVFAIISAALFITAALLLMARDRIRLKSLLLAGFFTSTIGIVLLLAFQRLAQDETQFEVSGNAGAVHYLLVVIAYCYSLTEQNDGNIWVEAIAYTLSVGVCEEIVKLLPVLFRLHWHKLSEIDARLLGFVSGVGFGVAEGVHYSVHFYNGSAGGMIYVVRFVSCVGFHAFATATAASLVIRYRVDEEPGGWLYLGKLVWAILPVIVFHAFYDTLVGHPDLVLWSLCPAVGMFISLVYQIESKPWLEEGGTQTRLSG